MDRDILDLLYVKAKLDPEMWESHDFDKDFFTWNVAENLKAILRIKASVKLLTPESIESTEGKAKRVIDLRKT